MRHARQLVCIALLVQMSSCAVDGSTAPTSSPAPAAAADVTLSGDQALQPTVPAVSAPVGSADATVATADADDTTTTAVADPAQSIPTAATSAAGGNARPPAATNTSEQSTPPTTGTPALSPAARVGFESACAGTTSSQAGEFDLGPVLVTQSPDGVVLSAAYTGDATQHDVVITFRFTDSETWVEAERFENGSGVARMYDPASTDSVFLDPPQDIANGNVQLVVRNDLLGDDRVRGPAVVTMRVDGADIETCA